MDLHEYSVTYADLDASLAAIGGAQGLIVMLPAMLPNLPSSVLDSIEEGIRSGMPVDVSVSLPGLGLSYAVHLRGNDAASDVEGA